jgi:hypothetical protein
MSLLCNCVVSALKVNNTIAHQLSRGHHHLCPFLELVNRSITRVRTCGVMYILPAALFFALMTKKRRSEQQPRTTKKNPWRVHNLLHANKDF